MPTINLYPNPGKHVSVIGQNGSGKTTYTYILLQQAAKVRCPIAILDTKGEELFDGLPIYTKLKTINRDTDIIVYRPELNELHPDYLDAFLQRMYHRPRSSTVLVNELSSLGTGAIPSPGLLSLVSRGRKHLVNGKPVRTTFIGETQRPRLIPLQVFTEMKHFAVFRLIDLRDRKRVTEFTHPMLIDNPKEKHGFWYWNNEMLLEVPMQVMLNLKTKRAA